MWDGAGLIALFSLIFVHLFANKTEVLGWVWHGRFLSFAGGISFAYVFIDLLPALGEGQPVLKRTIGSVIPFLDRHAYLIALLGVLFSYGLQMPSQSASKRSFLFSIFGYQMFNFFVGTSLADSTNPEIQPLTLFTIALAMHYFVHDHNLRENHQALYDRYGRCGLVLALVLGYLCGNYFRIPDAVVAILVAFLAGGMLLNVLHYELPKKGRGSYFYFVGGALAYSAILLGVGAV